MMKHALLALLAAGAIALAVSGCGHSCRTPEDCYSEVVANDSVATFAGGTLAVVGRVSQTGHPFSIAVKFSHLDYKNLAQAPAMAIWIFARSRTAREVFTAVSCRFESACSRPGRAYRKSRSSGTKATSSISSVPIDVIASQSAERRSRCRVWRLETRQGRGREGWFPQRYCVSHAKNERGDSTTIGVDQFTLPGGQPFADPDAGIHNETYGC